ncbi:cytochrome-c oxidase, cbb3-type subunit III [Moraxella sp. FZFQ2102]|uniref:cytochrome-c oxidase, cbb3-type subunit III n=1 Tax=Moraxella sp. FZFQ2102 TaxID=2953752 RepID=UPI00209C611F|nr:cytochrome-c oxidase, cbb3-type subunit III [Moraxella sp. FZFQ2102]USZ14440.1 cytochrome-c oxidase, cbb3-type subunit III [Moraxella sp. FZFQ2102]
MSFFWGSWITILSLGCWLFIFGVLVWTLKSKPALEEDGTTGHEYDGIREYDKPLPKWWLVIFFGTLIWGLGYFVLFPAIMPNAWKGVTTVEVDGQPVYWTSANELNSQLQANNKVFIENFEQNILANAGASEATAILAKLNDLQAQQKPGEENADLQKQINDQITLLAPYVEKLAADPEAQKIGNRLFLQNCALCHGSNAEGAAGYPNLTDNDWLHGGNTDQILLTIHNGRNLAETAGMPNQQKVIGEAGVKAVAEYVLSISGNQNGYELDAAKVTQGKAIFETTCAVCHGPDAKGQIAVGSPNLTDDTWLFGGDRDTIQTSIRYGRRGVMPEWHSKLGNERVMLLAAYVRSLSQDQAQ